MVAKERQSKSLSMDKRIQKAVALGPMASLYFVVGIDMLKAHIDGLDDEDLRKMFDYLIHPDRVRSNINQIHKILNNLPDE